jgi:hypothetical protein
MMLVSEEKRRCAFTHALSIPKQAKAAFPKSRTPSSPLAPK